MIGENLNVVVFLGILMSCYVVFVYMFCVVFIVFVVFFILVEFGNVEINKGVNLMMLVYVGVFFGVVIMGGIFVILIFVGIFLIIMLFDGFLLMGVFYYYSDGVVSFILFFGVVVFLDMVWIWVGGLKVLFG